MTHFLWIHFCFFLLFSAYNFTPMRDWNLTLRHSILNLNKKVRREIIFSFWTHCRVASFILQYKPFYRGENNYISHWSFAHFFSISFDLDKKFSQWCEVAVSRSYHIPPCIPSLLTTQFPYNGNNFIHSGKISCPAEDGLAQFFL